MITFIWKMLSFWSFVHEYVLYYVSTRFDWTPINRNLIHMTPHCIQIIWLNPSHVKSVFRHRTAISVSSNLYWTDSLMTLEPWLWHWSSECELIITLLVCVLWIKIIHYTYLRSCVKTAVRELRPALMNVHTYII